MSFQPPAPGTLVLRPWLAALLSLGIPGLGEMYCGRRRLGAAVLVLSIFTLYGCGLAPVLSAIHAAWLASVIRRRPLQPGGPAGGGSLLGDVARDLLD